MIALHVDPRWTACFPGARLGLLEARGLAPLASHPGLEELRVGLETELRRTCGGLDRKALRELPGPKSFEAHFRAHGGTYHVLQQLESVAAKGRPIPSRLCAVTALFMAELKHGLVAAGHDLDRIEPPLRLAPSTGEERYVNLSGSEKRLPAGDMILHHGRGLLSSVLQGPGQDTPIGPGTRNAVFTIYAPASVPQGLLEAQLRDLAEYLAVFSPEASLEWRTAPE